MELITLSVGLGLVVSLVFSELLGAAAGGMVVPGYIALSLDRPLTVLLTIFAAVLTFLLVHALGTIMILYGRRRTVLMILVGFIMGALLRQVGSLPLSYGSLDLSVVGYIIPGLIAIWIDRQGMWETLATLVTASVVVRLGLILITGGEMAL
ncbi:MAG: poly-gamma-glutamate biosynthesis protein PgsC [Myxococcota bacterium]|jgi:poly-gamma-glutamate biosynthesis protein PgsC/CapC|nr:poly-gamma-glutamate biosynthesis protein PgsC [Myxococcota bacterium]